MISYRDILNNAPLIVKDNLFKHLRRVEASLEDAVLWSNILEKRLRILLSLLSNVLLQNPSTNYAEIAYNVDDTVDDPWLKMSYMLTQVAYRYLDQKRCKIAPFSAKLSKDVAMLLQQCEAGLASYNKAVFDANTAEAALKRFVSERNLEIQVEFN